MNIQPGNERYHSLDALRTVAMLSVIIGHTAGAYGSVSYLGIQWPIKNETESSVLFFGNIGLLINAFCMQLFFVISGFFAAMSFERRGVRMFIFSRSKRILLPFILSLIFIWPLVYIIVFMGLFDVEFISGWLNNDPRLKLLREYIVQSFQSGEVFSRFELGHLWFLWYLLAFYALFTVIKTISPFLKVKQLLNRCFAWIWQSPLSLLLLAIPTTLLQSFMIYPVGVDSHGVTVAPMGFYFPLYLFAYYVFFFAIGTLLYHQRQLLSLTQQRWIPHFVISIISMAGYFLCVKEQLVETMPWVTHCIHAIWTWSTILALFGYFLKYFNKPNPKWRYLSEASFWIYLVHSIPVFYLQIIVKNWDMSPFIKFVFVLTILTPLLLLSYHYCVRHTLIGTLLNGRKRIKA